MAMDIPRTLLALLSHPDDESFGPGGTLARYAAEGVQVHVVIATDGDAGSVAAGQGPGPGRSLAQHRQEELARAAVILGLASVWNLPYRDSGMPGQPDNHHPRALIRQPWSRLVAEMVDFIRRLRPQVVITHDPYGGYGHPDHIRVCQVATAAFHLAGDPRYCPDPTDREPLPPHTPHRLYYFTLDKGMLRTVVWFLRLRGQDPRALGRNRDIDLVTISRWHTPIHARIPVEAYLARKEAASRAHASQYSGGPGFLGALPSVLQRHFRRHECFVQAFPTPPARPVDDLFAGLDPGQALPGRAPSPG